MSPSSKNEFVFIQESDESRDTRKGVFSVPKSSAALSAQLGGHTYSYTRYIIVLMMSLYASMRVR